MPDRTEAQRIAERDRILAATQPQINRDYLGKLVKLDTCGMGCCGTVIGIVTGADTACVTIKTRDPDDNYNGDRWNYDYVLDVYQGGTQ